MEQQTPQKPRFLKAPILIGRLALLFAVVPLAMCFLCAVTRNSLFSLIDLYYTFVTPMWICKWSVVTSLIFSFLTRLAIGSFYISDSNAYLYRELYNEANKYYLRAVFLTLLELAVYFVAVVSASN